MLEYLRSGPHPPQTSGQPVKLLVTGALRGFCKRGSKDPSKPFSSTPVQALKLWAKGHKPPLRRVLCYPIGGPTWQGGPLAIYPSGPLGTHKRVNLTGSQDPL